MEGRLHESVKVIREHLSEDELDQEVVDLGAEISGSGRFVPASLAEELVGELTEARKRAHRQVVRVEMVEAVRPADLGVLDTSECFGEEKVYMWGCEAEAIDERNLAACSKLEVQCSSVQCLDTQSLRSLEYLNIGWTKITELDTIPLGNLRELWVDSIKISSLDTSSLGNLQVLGAWRTDLSSLDTRPLASLREVYVKDTQIRALDTRPMRELERMSIYNTHVKFVSTAGLALKCLDINDTQINRVHIATGWKLGRLEINGSGIRFIDGRERMQIKYLCKDYDQAVLRDEWVEEE